MKQHNTFGDHLRYWRKARHKTQLDISIESGYSQRHISFLESGRSSPSRDAVIVLAETLDVPMTRRNALLEAAGFAPVYTHEPLSSEHLAYAREAVSAVLSSHRPFPAVIVDRAWNTIGGNDPALALFHKFIQSPTAYPSLAETNAIRICLDEDGMKPFIRNWHAFMQGVLGELKQALDRDVSNGEISALIDEIRIGLDADTSDVAVAENDFPIARLELARAGDRVELFTMMSAFNFPLDATIAELRIETFFPANAESREFLIGLDKALAPEESAIATP